MFYRNIFKINVEKNCPQNVVDFCPQKIFKIKDNKVIAENTEKCDMCGVCLEECKKQGKVIDLS